MGKFDGMLLCTDLDDTLLTTDKRVSEKNLQAIEYFKSEGGSFTFVTGRVPAGARLILDYVRPNAPVVCYNGAAIYDFASEKFLWKLSLPDEAADVVEFMKKGFPACGIEICSEDRIYFARHNRLTREHRRLENFPDNFIDYRRIEQEWIKVIFMVEEDEIPAVKNALLSSEWAERFDFIRSSPWYYELLPKGSSKGGGMLRLAELCGILPENTIGMGDNDNDLSLVSMAGTGVAVENAVEEVKRAAAHIAPDNNSDAVYETVRWLEQKRLTAKR